MRSSLEKLCQQLGLSYTWDSDGICVLASAHYPQAAHSIKISMTANGRIGILTIFPECGSKEIKDVEDFCDEVKKFFVSGATLSFDSVGGYFFIYDVTDRWTLKEYLDKLAHDCDIAAPLLASVGEQGYCNHYAVWLAHQMPSECGASLQ